MTIGARTHAWRVRACVHAGVCPCVWAFVRPFVRWWAIAKCPPVQVVIHPPEYVADPSHKGFSISPGKLTSAAMRSNCISRLGLPYDNCDCGSNENDEHRLSGSHVRVCTRQLFFELFKSSKINIQSSDRWLKGLRKNKDATIKRIQFEVCPKTNDQRLGTTKCSQGDRLILDRLFLEEKSNDQAIIV